MQGLVVPRMGALPQHFSSLSWPMWWMKEVKSDRGWRVFRLNVRCCDRAALYIVGVILHPLVVRHACSLSCFDPRKSLNCLWCIVCVQAHIDFLQSTQFPCDYTVCALHCGMVDTIFRAAFRFDVLWSPDHCDVSVFYHCVCQAQADDYHSNSSDRGAVPKEVSHDHWWNISVIVPVLMIMPCVLTLFVKSHLQSWARLLNPKQDHFIIGISWVTGID
jgi:hypothetical protein